MPCIREMSLDSILPDPMLSDLVSYLTDSDCDSVVGLPQVSRDTFANSSRGRIRRKSRRQSRRVKESLGYMAGA